MSRTTSQALGAIAFAVCFAATFLPWVKSGDLFDIHTETGLNSVGIVVLPLAAVGALILVKSGSVFLSFLAAVIAVALIGVGVIAIIDVRSGIDNQLGGFNDLLGVIGEDVKVGEGLYVLVAGAVVALVSSLMHAASFVSKRGSPQS